MKREFLWLAVLGLAACQSEGETDYLVDSPDTNAGSGGNTGLIVSREPSVMDPIRVSSSGSIKSYFDDTELEPPFETGSIFATGYSHEAAAGMGGAAPSLSHTEWVEALGLGSGDLTVLALFDRSVSMSDPWEGQPRWQAAGRAFMNGLQGYEETVTIGTLFFPQAAECEVAPFTDPRQIQFQAGTRYKQHWEAFPQNRFPSGGTPLGGAFEEADRVVDLAEEYGLLGAGRRFRVAVITDGKPNCGTDEERVIFLAEQWRSRGVEIHVIGLPGSDEASAFLDRLAQVGGTARQSPTDLAEAEDSFSVIVR